MSRLARNLGALCAQIPRGQETRTSRLHCSVYLLNSGHVFRQAHIITLSTIGESRITDLLALACLPLSSIIPIV